MKSLKFLCLILIATLFLPVLSCEKNGAPRKKTYYEYFDTVCSVISYADESEADFESKCDQIKAQLEKYHRLFDIYNEYTGMNNLCTVNKNAGITEVTVDRELIDLLLYAKEIHTLTEGEMNVAMGAVLSLWHDQRESAAEDPDRAALPSHSELEEAKKHVSIENIIIDIDTSSVYLTDSLASIDVGALGKGYAAERIAEYLKDMGVKSYVLDIGGNLRTIGTKPDGEGWITGITNPSSPDSSSFAARITIFDTSCVTSGDYERGYTVNGKNYHHIIDKDTCYPAEYFSSVTVVTDDSALADSLSTALFCMPYKEGAELVKKIGGAEVLWITAEGQRYSTEGFSSLEIK